MRTKDEICSNWLPRYTGVSADDLTDYILLTNFQSYVERFSAKFSEPINGLDKVMPSCTCPNNNISIINCQMGSANAATIMDLLSAKQPKGVLFLGRCGGLKNSTEIGNFILPIAAIRGDGTSNDYFPPEVPALPSFKMHKFISQKLVEHGHDYRTGVVYTTNRRVWEYDEVFKARLHDLTVLGIDMETATIFIVGHKNTIPRGALLLVTDVPMTPEGVKTENSDRTVSSQWADIHLDIGIQSLVEIQTQGEEIKHFTY